ncbi:aspartyl protease family protein 2 [Selaginella moellendorffii]|nr:aspartyl protease family protein 2 [Selaginella moellendorffii]|eukprot:XP_002986201.2 aspartyl protease family protein 2 [Selaginella moellendorffii]
MADSACGDVQTPSRRVLLEESRKTSLKMELKHRDHRQPTSNRRSLLLESLKRDITRLQSFQKRVSEKLTASANPEAYLEMTNSSSTKSPPSPSSSWEEVDSTVESGAELGAGEYFMDVFVGNPPRHFLLIIDTGSDLTWLQCKPCKACFDQSGPVFDPSQSTSFKIIPCNAAACDLVVHDECRDNSSKTSPKTCKYFYWYGDSSRTSGDLALESLSVSLSDHPSSLEIRDMVIGCGHSNKGLFQGAGGLLGLGQGALSFPSQLRSSPIGQSFSYCLVDRTNNLSVSSAISFGAGFALSRHFDQMKFTPFVRTNNSVETFYYLGIQGIKIDQELLPIPAERFAIATNGSGGTIIDSGTTLTYLNRDAYRAVESAFLARISYPRADPFDILGICYNATGRAAVPFPALSIVFQNGAELDLPQENYFIQPDPQEAKHCLAILPTDGMSIIGNFQQQNIHFLYDVQHARLGFANTDCSAL